MLISALSCWKRPSVIIQSNSLFESWFPFAQEKNSDWIELVKTSILVVLIHCGFCRYHFQTHPRFFLRVKVHFCIARVWCHWWRAFLQLAGNIFVFPKKIFSDVRRKEGRASDKETIRWSWPYEVTKELFVM